MCALVSGMIRAAFSYAGEKCSAAARAYIPASLWKEVRAKLHTSMQDVYAGDIRDPRAFCNAVIDERAFVRIKG